MSNVYLNKKIKSKKERRGNKEKKKSSVRTKLMCTRAFLSIKQSYFFPSVISSFWGENFLMGSKEKHLNPTIYFPSSLPNQIYSKKVFLPIFPLQFFIHPISFFLFFGKLFILFHFQTNTPLIYEYKSYNNKI